MNERDSDGREHINKSNSDGIPKRTEKGSDGIEAQLPKRTVQHGENIRQELPKRTGSRSGNIQSDIPKTSVAANSGTDSMQRTSDRTESAASGLTERKGMIPADGQRKSADPGASGLQKKRIGQNLAGIRAKGKDVRGPVSYTHLTLPTN